MEFLDKLGKKASEAYKITADKTGKLAKETKLKFKIGDLRTKISDLYEEIGKKVYEAHIREDEEAKENIGEELKSLCIKIDVLSDEIEDLLKQCLELKNRKQCKNCYTEIDIEYKYCPKCGAKQDNNEESREVKEDTENKKDEQEENNNDNSKNLEKTITVESNVENNDEDEEEE